MNGIAALQPYVIGLFLLWAGLVKLFGRRLRAQAGQSALARLVGPARAVPAFRLIGVLELAVAAALLLPPVLPLEGAAATGLCAGFLAYLTYARRAAPTSSCGCLGAHSRPVDRRGFARAGLLLAASVVAVWARPYPIDPPLAVVGLAEAAALLLLSPELDRHWLVPLRRLLVRLRRPLAAPSPQDVPLEVTLRLLYLSPAYCSASARLTSDVLDVWDEDGLRFVVYGAGGATAVFAAPLSGDDPAAVRVALIEEPALA
ncbi:MauE/DoxX family redox-associated membrane protein [Sphaerisporangium perillae]|uniref:MauE/DoxX family redox-associated membrane protein n=1 Tax=Sphaerisporangium perillae TaxID=2935860 RepID=UPI0020106E34|nr:MauE/DoxX family redox-associated membrane protein [Sphaerisporangium perillae]